MAKQIINIGNTLNDGTGDTLRSGASKINQNFDEIYSILGTGETIGTVTSVEAGEGIGVSNNAGTVTITNTSPNRGSFRVVAVAGQENIIADSLTDTLTLVAGSNVTLSTNSTTDTLTISATNQIQQPGDWSAVSGVTRIINKPVFAAVATTGAYSDLSGRPTLATVATSGSYADLTGKPNFSAVATSGLYSDLAGKPTMFSGAYADLTGKPTLSDVAQTGQYADLLGKPTLFSGNYTDLTNKPTIPSNTNQLTNGANFITLSSLTWSNVTGKPTFASVAISGNYTDLINKPTIPTSLLNLGITDGTAGQVLTTDGAGSFAFTTVSGGGGGGAMASRTTAATTTASIANNATDNITITGFKSYMLLKVQTSAAAWVRLYTDTASRTADATRDILTDPNPGSGVLAEFITSGAQTVLVTPAVLGFSGESFPTTSIPVAVTNKSGATTTITVTLTLLQLEA